MAIELGDRVRDVVSGFEGIAIARLIKLFTESEIKIEPERLTDEGRPFEGIWFEESRCERCK